MISTILKGAKLEWIKLKAPDGNLIELLKYHSHSEDKEISKQKSYKLGSSHIAFTVDNIDEMCKLIENAGGSITDFEGKKVLYGKENFENPSLIIKRKNNLNE